jgi:TatD DNase family protein
MTFYDTHAHLDFPQFADELTQVVDRAGQAGISRILTIGTDGESSRRAIQLAERFDHVWAVVGWHPNEAGTAPEDPASVLRPLAAHPKVVALGETGLDYYRLPSRERGGSTEEDVAAKQQQARVFRQHLELAAELGLNCVIHQREALEDTLRIMSEYAGRVRGQFHCFVDSAEAMRRVLAIGSLVSFTGILTFKNGANVRETLTQTPMGEFMLETDCPFLAPEPHRKKRCEPAHVRDIAELAAKTKGCSLEDLSAATCEAATRFFPKLR